MSDEEANTLFFLGFVMAIILSKLAYHTLGDGFDLEVVNKWSTLCESNGGLESMETDYDIICNNGAEFDFSWDRYRVDFGGSK